MHTYFIKSVRNGIFLNIELWKKEWSLLMLTNTTVPINKKRFIFQGNSVENWIAKKILEDLLLSKTIDIGR